MTGSERQAASGRRITRRRWTALAALSAAAIVSCSQSGGEPSGKQAEGTAPSTPAPSAGSPAIGEPPVLEEVDAVRTVVISDEGTIAPGGASPAWPEVLADVLEDIGIPMSVVTTAPEGAGFTSSPSFADLVAENAEGSTQLVVLFDSRVAGTDTLPEAAHDTFTAVERAAPDAMLVVVGPLTADGGMDPTRASADLEAATERAGGTYVDPLVEGWPSDVTHAEMAELLRLHLQPLAESLAASGANR